MSRSEMGQVSEWRIAVKGEQRGPYTLDQIRAMISEGRLPPDALVWRPGMANWTPWGNVPELAAVGRGPVAGAMPGIPASSMPPTVASMPQTTPLADFLAFRTMLTPVLIKILFWIGVVFCLIAGIGNLLIAFRADSITGLVFALLFMFAGPIFVRVWCELMILWFRIHETLQQIKDQRK